jgi:hypothetical protein
VNTNVSSGLLVDRDLHHLGKRERLSLKPGLDPQQRPPLSVDFQAQLVGADDAEPPERPVVMAFGDRGEQRARAMWGVRRGAPR